MRPPSPTATAAGALGPSSRRTVHDVVPVATSIAVTSSRSTMIASPPAITGAGRPAMWVSSPIPVAICHRDRSGGAGETDTTPACCGPPWYWVHASAGCAEAAAAEAIPAIMMAAGIDRMIGRERKVRHPTGGTLCAGLPASCELSRRGRVGRTWPARWGRGRRADRRTRRRASRRDADAGWAHRDDPIRSTRPAGPAGHDRPS